MMDFNELLGGLPIQQVMGLLGGGQSDNPVLAAMSMMGGNPQASQGQGNYQGLLNGQQQNNPMLNFLSILKKPGLPPGGVMSDDPSAPKSAPIGSDFMPGGGYPTQPPSPGMGQSLSPDKAAMLQQLKDAATKAYPDNPVMQQVAITQAIHESGLMGRPSRLASEDNNYFGIKAPGTAGTVNMRTQEYGGNGAYMTNAGFGRNATMADSFQQHHDLMNKNRYQSVNQSRSPSEAFQTLQRSGYATDPKYARQLNRVYDQYVAPLYMPGGV